MEEKAATWDENPQEFKVSNDWVECVTDNGDIYFTNVVNGETSWTKPEFEQNQAIWTGDDNTRELSMHEENTEETELLVKSAIIEAGEVAQWMELYDSDQQAVYYFSPKSGEVRLESPQEEIVLVRQCNSDAVLSSIVSLQSAARSQQTRARVAAIRQQKLKERQLEDDSTSSHHQYELNGESGAEASQLDSDSQWVEVYDPATQQQYYYSPRTSETSWDRPEAFVSVAEDRRVAAAISIQSLSRGRLARKRVHDLRAQFPLRDKHVTVLEEDELECEAINRREMNQQELLQLEGGDRFWGLDNYEHEMIQRRMEEELIARTKALNEHRFSISPQPTSVGNILLDYLEFDEEKMDTERLQQQSQEEYDARVQMSREETQQCQDGDSFWGIQAEEIRQHTSNIAMAQEEAASRRFADDALKQALSVTWEAEVLQNAAKELAARGGQEQRMRERYFQWFYHHCVSVDELLEYRWPTKQQQECLENSPSPGKRRHQAIQLHSDAMASATPYPLDDLIVRERLEHGDLRYGLRSILTVHHQNSRGTNGTHFEITMASPECAYDEVVTAALLKSQTLVYPSDQSMNSDEGSLNGFERQEDRIGNGSQNGELTSGSSINYHRSRTPDPHIPARFNGVPYKPNQISPTREILSGDHRKLNQLPSLVRLRPSAESPQFRHFQKAKVKARVKAKQLSYSARPSPNNENGTDSARESETDQATDAADEGPRAQFKRQELDVLSKLFALMDLDESGTVNEDEMRWALQRDAEIHALATTSQLLRLLLKQRTRLEVLFSSQLAVNSNTDVVSRNESSNELSLDEFLARCEHSYLNLMSEGLIQPDAVAATKTHTKMLLDSKNDFHEKHPKQSTRETEAQTIRRVFALLDFDQNGVIDIAEVQQALYNSTAATPKHSSRPNSTGVVSKELRALVEGSKALQPMLHQELFMTAFTRFEPMDPRGICEEEFVAFCLEIANVAATNNMVESVG